MIDYRVYCLDGRGKFQSAEWVPAHSDDEAIGLVRAMQTPMHCEVWDGNRLVATMPAHVATSGINVT